jgi:DNA-binding MarR family transcriptional regulator
MQAVSSSLAIEIADTAQSLRRAFDRRAAALGTTRAQWRVLARLAQEDGQRQIDLADALDVEPITLCRMIDRLSEAGLVARTADDSDRRARRVHLTAKARPVVESLRGVASDFFAEALAGVSSAEQDALSDALRRIRSNLSDAARSASPARESTQ